MDPQGATFLGRRLCHFGQTDDWGVRQSRQHGPDITASVPPQPPVSSLGQCVVRVTSHRAVPPMLVLGEGSFCCSFEVTEEPLVYPLVAASPICRARGQQFEGFCKNSQMKCLQSAFFSYYFIIYYFYF